MNEEILELIQQGQILSGNGEVEEAIKYFDKALEQDEMNYTAYVSKAVALINMGSMEEAQENLKRAMLVDKKNPDAYLHMGNIYLMDDEYDDAIKNYNQAIAYGYEDADIYYFIGLVYENQQDYEVAARNYSKAIMKEGMNPIYRIRKATVLIKGGEYNEALQALEELRTFCPESFEGYHLTAAVYTILEQYDKADDILSFAEGLFPEDLDIINDRIRVLLAKGELDAAIEKISLVEMKTTDELVKKEMLLSKGKIFAQKENEESAKQNFIDALNSGEETSIDSEILFMLLNLCMIQKEYIDAKKYAEQLANLPSENEYSLGGKYYVGMIMKMENENLYEDVLKEAISFYRKFSLQNPARVDAYLYRAMCYKDLNDYDKALESVHYVELLQPKSGHLHTIKGNIYKEMGQEEKAKEEFEKAKNLGVNSFYMGG